MKGRARREEILGAANRAFAERGYRGASLSAIAESVGLSQPSLLHHFGSEEELLWEVLRLRHERDIERVRGVTAERESYLEALLELARENQRSPGVVLFASGRARSSSPWIGSSFGTSNPGLPSRCSPSKLTRRTSAGSVNSTPRSSGPRQRISIASSPARALTWPRMPSIIPWDARIRQARATSARVSSTWSITIHGAYPVPGAPCFSK